MDKNLMQVKREIYDPCFFNLSGYEIDSESQAYDACQFELNGRKIISRSGKVTPKKSGQFVTFWKRIQNGPIEPFHEQDDFDYFIVNVRFEERLGQFVFPKALLVKKAIVSTEEKEGKRAFRVYLPWDLLKSKQAQRSQKWQTEYFYEVHDKTDLKKVQDLYIHLKDK